MKTILVPTDFSVPAENAAHYANSLAKRLFANILLCHAYNVPSDAPMAAQIAWPLMEEADLDLEAQSSLNDLIKEMCANGSGDETGKCPKVAFDLQKGEVCKVITDMVKLNKADLVVMGMSGAGKIVQWALGSNSKKMIDYADFPVLYVPYPASYKEIKKIGFATAFSVDDLEHLQYLCRLAEDLDAEVIVYHITSFDVQHFEEDHGLDRRFNEEVAAKLNYPKISFQAIWHSNVNEGLKYIINEEGVDLLAMVHQQHGLLDKLFNGSHVLKVSRITQIPLLVFQPCEKLYKI
ncbi:universal stress protein [Pedobacter sp. Du54]|uniref:universal stress protein n=1 Tax=Pedobacter anseongensis TaxID=3133439 RepID=UPI00309690D8